jgi:predicted DCC family thiol-disulfide oxidoreductase YuxK
VFYDADCAFCTRWARRGQRWLAGKGYRFEPMPVRRGEMQVVTADGRTLGGAEALAHLARQVWWAWPLWALSRLPGMMPLLRWGYRQVAARRQCRLYPRLQTLTRRWE